jgi:acetylornithine deacetylase/succinyl-diaminopimelate desuccinylase family protein
VRVNPLEQQLMTWLQERESQMVALCQRMIQTRSVNGVDPERNLAELIAREAASLGLRAELHAMQPERPNVVVSTTRKGETRLLLIGHLDTVPAGDETAWSHPPFAGAISGGRIYGRGAVDTKSGMTAALYALAALGAVLGAGEAKFIGVPDEESGATGTLGIKYLHDQGLLGGRGAIYAYSGQQITLGHRGLVRYRLICRGEAVHTGFDEWQEGSAGANAVTGMARLLLALEATHFPYSSTPYFERYRTLITPGTVINGGVSVNIVPDTCEALVDCRLTPEVSRADVDARIQQIVEQIAGQHPRLRYEVELLNDAPAAITPEDAAIVPALESAIHDVTGTQPERLVAGPANEGYLLIERGIPTICGMGPTGGNAHALDEYVEIKGLVEAAIIFALTACRL